MGEGRRNGAVDVGGATVNFINAASDLANKSTDPMAQQAFIRASEDLGASVGGLLSSSPLTQAIGKGIGLGDGILNLQADIAQFAQAVDQGDLQNQNLARLGILSDVSSIAQGGSEFLAGVSALTDQQELVAPFVTRNTVTPYYFPDFNLSD